MLVNNFCLVAKPIQGDGKTLVHFVRDCWPSIHFISYWFHPRAVQRHFVYVLCTACMLFISSELFCVLDEKMEGIKRKEMKRSKIRIPARQHRIGPFPEEKVTWKDYCSHRSWRNRMVQDPGNKIVNGSITASFTTLVLCWVLWTWQWAQQQMSCTTLTYSVVRPRTDIYFCSKHVK